MKKVLKVLAGLAAIGAVVGGIVYFNMIKKREFEEDFDDFDDFDDFEDLEDVEEEEDNAERVYTPINLDSDADTKEEAKAEKEA